MAKLDFDPSKYDVEEALNTVAPEGNYELMATECKVKTAKSGGGDYLEYKFKFLNGPKKNYGFYHRFFLWNSKEETAKKNRTWFNVFCQSVRISPSEPNFDTSDLLNMPFIGEVTVEKSEGYEPKNGLKPWGFHSIEKSAEYKSPEVLAKSIDNTAEYEDDVPF